ncbi:RusA family crossover junction endodeoxyribonuclease, partial [Tatumella punctata]
SVTIYASPPDIRTRDLDNLSKGVLDALTKAGFWLDDGQIDVLRLERLEKRKGGGLLVVVRELEGELKQWEDVA